MAEVTPPVAPPAPPPPPVAPPAPKLAGKYDDSAALQKGARELFAKTGILELPETAKLVGEGGLYKDDAALETAYKKAERLMGNQKLPAEVKVGEPGIKVETEAPPVPDDVDIDGVLKSVGLEGKDLAEQYMKDGKLDPAAYKKLNGKGFSNKVINDFMEGQMARGKIAQAEQSAIRTGAIELVGGEEQFNNLIKNAHQFVTDKAELADIAQRATKPGSWKGAMRDLLDHYNRSIGAEGSTPLASGGIKPVAAGPAKNAKEFGELRRAAAKGDKAAVARIMATSDSAIAAWDR